jgi:PKD repeat protein
VPVVRCDWNFGDFATTTSAAGATVMHRYAAPGDYNVTLKVTDVEGCTSFATRMVKVKGPKVAFTASATNVQLNTTVFVQPGKLFFAKGP